jgi:hypothetical protein
VVDPGHSDVPACLAGSLQRKSAVKIQKYWLIFFKTFFHVKTKRVVPNLFLFGGKGLVKKGRQAMISHNSKP